MIWRRDRPRNRAPEPDTRTLHVVAPLAGTTEPGALAFGGDLDAFHQALLASPRFDAVEDRAGPAKAMARLVRLIPRINSGGTLTLHLTTDSMRQRLRTLAGDLDRVRAEGVTIPNQERDFRPRPEQELHALAATVDHAVTDDRAVFTLRREQRTRLNESELLRLLPARPDLGQVIAEIPATDGSPAVTARELHGASCGLRQQTYTDELVLPDSYRDPYSDRSPARLIQHWSRAAAHLSMEEVATPLPGTWFHLDNQIQPHFGHTMTEQLSRTWAWGTALERHPDLKALVTGPLPAWQRDLFAAAGVEDHRLVSFDAAVTPERLITASPMYVIGSHIHPAMTDVYDRVGDALVRSAAGPVDTMTAPRLFLTRASDRRAPDNLDQVHALVESLGFAVVRPEEHSLAAQVAGLRSAEVVAGIAGSNMFSIAFAWRPVPVIAVTSDRYHAHNERHLSALRGHDLTILRSAAIVDTNASAPTAMHAKAPVDLSQLRNRLTSVVGC